MIDSHCHLEYMENPDEVIAEAKKRMAAVVTSVPNPDDFQRVFELHRRHPGFVFVAAGFHAEYLERFNDRQIGECIDMIRKNAGSIVSVGEVGLDYFWIKEREQQERSIAVFEKFIDLAAELDKPLTIHCRNGTDDGISQTIEVLKRKNAKNVMMHCFSGSDENLQDCLGQGWHISFATLVVRSRKHQRFAKATPLEKMLLETDAPWLDPDSRELTNRPWKIERSAEVIAGLKGIAKEQVLKATEDNARKFFRLQLQ